MLPRAPPSVRSAPAASAAVTRATRMHLPSGTRIGSYEVLDPIGAGAMGEVYRAKDHRLGRDVALKVLPEGLAGDPDALARLEREARFVAALSHPNIAVIHGIEEDAGGRLLVLELVPGETLEELLARGPLPLDQALRIGAQVAAGLEAAHEAGIVHRDLKPSNVKITPRGTVKLIDFGIAKHHRGTMEAGRFDAAAGQPALTRTGTVVGTPQYMSPEQLFGETTDRSADVWAFGCLLYEMLTGRRAFSGATVLDLAEAVRSRDPDWSALPKSTPDSLRRLAMRCLRKDPHERLHDIGDARLELEEMAQDRATLTRRARRRPRLTLAAAGLVALAALAAFAFTRTRHRAPGDMGSRPVRLTQLTSAEGVEEFAAWSPDGEAIAYAGDVGGIRKLFIRRIAEGTTEQLTTGGHDDVQPAWSPDGRRIVFVRATEAGRRLEPRDVFSSYDAGGDLWSIDVAGRRESRLAQSAYNPRFSPDGRAIAVDASWAGPRRIWVVDQHGLNPKQVTSDSSEAVFHIRPQWSPDGRRMVYQRVEQTRFGIAIVNVATGRSTTVAQDVYRHIDPVWGPDGRTIYHASDAGGGMNLWRLTVDATDRVTGPPQQVTSGAGQDVQIAVAPDGQRLAYTTLHQNADLWRLPLDANGMPAGPAEPLVASTREDSRGAWSPDGAHVAFNSDRGGTMNLWIHSIGDRTTRQLTHGPGGDFQPAWSPDGRSLTFFSSRAGKTDIWTVDVATGKLAQLTRSRSLAINPFYSPDGRHIVFQSDASGRLELWLMASNGSQVRQLTHVGAWGHFVRWLPDGYIYFRSMPGGPTLRVRPDGAEPEVASEHGGAHISFTRDMKHIMDVRMHKALWLSPLSGAARKVFEFDEADVRIDYPVLSPDSRWVLFDRLRPGGGDLWIAEGIR